MTELAPVRAVTRIGVPKLLMARLRSGFWSGSTFIVEGMRRHQTSRRSSTAEVVTADAWLEIVTEDEITLTAEAAAVLARIVREHLNQPQPAAAPAAARHASAAH